MLSSKNHPSAQHCSSGQVCVYALCVMSVRWLGRYHGVAGEPGGGTPCSHLLNYDPDRALTDYIARLEALQRRLGSVQSGKGVCVSMCVCVCVCGSI